MACQIVRLAWFKFAQTWSFEACQGQEISTQSTLTAIMTRHVDLAIIGAGPAGLAAAGVAAQAGVATVVIDEQGAPGGQIYRGGERASPDVEGILGPEYARGRVLGEALAHSLVTHVGGAIVWRVTQQREIHLTKDGVAQALHARHIIIATGALERAMPFPGWTLPGVMTVGAGQILLKTAGMIPNGRVILAGSGPLLYLLSAQYMRAGGKISAIVETTPRRNILRAAKHLPGILRANTYLRKGIGLLREIRRAGVRHFQAAGNLAARGHGTIETLRFVANGIAHELPCSLLFVHQGIVPNVQITRSLRLSHDWDELQRCWRPSLGPWGETEIKGISVAGDGGGIAGALAAELQGRIAGLHAANSLGAIDDEMLQRESKPERKALAHQLAARPFIDALYAPSPEFLSPPDETIACRCEEVTAATIRRCVSLGCLGPNQTKAFCRAGMGPCQGRFCGLTVAEIIASTRGVPVADVGYYRIRPPIKPVTIGELAALPADETD